MIIQDFVILILFNRHLLLVMTLNIIHDIFSLSNVMHSKGDKFITFDIKFIGMGQVSILLGHALNNQSKIFRHRRIGSNFIINIPQIPLMVVSAIRIN